MSADTINISEMIRTPRPEPLRPPEAANEAHVIDEDGRLPGPGDPYEAHGRVSARPRLTLHCLLEGGRRRGFAWSNYDGISLEPPGRDGSGPAVIVHFAGRQWIDLVIEGSNLLTLYDWLGEQKIGWIRECPPGRGPNGPDAVSIRKITVRDATPP
ncbi:hypothetical protein [Tautonia marina]|uniref:hypothetical protein n=1 Tax=Tautonia marina TaxID=2653855 RepID=UPI001260F445|nr:hypothetical protein [Tautonia marina]